MAIKKDKNLLNPLNLFIALVILVYIVKFQLIEYSNIVDLNFLVIDNDRFENLFNIALIYINIGTISFYIGYSMKIFNKFVIKLPSIKFSHSRLRILKFLMIILIAIGTLSIIIIIYLKGGINRAIRDIIFYRTALPVASPNFLYVLISYLPYGAVIGSIFFLGHFLETRNKVHVLVVLLFLGLLCLGLFPATGSRTQLLLPILSTIVILHLRTSRVRLKSLVFIMIGILVIFDVLGILRGMTHSGMEISNFTGRVKYRFGNLAWALGRILNGPSGFVSLLYLVPESIKPTYGHTFVKAFINMLPGSLIPFLEGGETIGNFLAKIVAPSKFADGGGFAPSLYGMFYLNFMLPGIIFFSFVNGVFSRIMYQYLNKRLSNYSLFNNTAYSIFFSYGLFTFYRSGDIIKIANDIFAIFLLLSFLLFICVIFGRKNIIQRSQNIYAM